MRRLGWFLVGAAGATGALVAAPGVYGKLREAVGAGDPWNDFELEPDGGYAPLREDAPAYAEVAPEEPVEAEAEAVAEPEPSSEPEPEPVAEAELVAEAEPEPEPEPVAEAEPEAPTDQSEVDETVVWPVPSAPTEEAEATAEDDADDDDTADITSTLTPAPPPEDTEATDLRSRIEASRERLRHKAQGGTDEEDEVEDEPDPGA